MKKIFLLMFFFDCCCAGMNAQSSYTTNWKVKAIEHELFIENRGQFSFGADRQEKILFQSQLGNITACFTSRGIIYRYCEPVKKEEDREHEEDKTKIPQIHYLAAAWEGSDPNVKVEAEQEQNYDFNYCGRENTTLKTKAFKKLIYRNLYPGIDVEYLFPEGQQGIKYNLTVHPGADLSAVKLKYEGVKKIFLDKNGRVIVKSRMGEFTEHAPVSCFENGEKISSAYEVKQNTVSFKLEMLNSEQETIIIDPWVTNPNFTPLDAAWDVDYDNQGNVYAYGGSNDAFELVKLNSSGIIQWKMAPYIYTTGSVYGDFCVDRSTGTSYIIQGGLAGTINGQMAFKINTSGVLVATKTGAPLFIENNRCVFDSCNHGIVIAGGGGGYNVGILDTNMSTMTTAPSTPPLSLDYYDISLMCQDPPGGGCSIYTVHGTPFFGTTAWDNMIVSVPKSGLSPIQYINPSNMWFYENAGSFYYDPKSSQAGGTMSYNGMAASYNWVYTFDGDKVQRFDKATGIATQTVALVGAPSVYRYSSGLDVDACDNLYVGLIKDIKVLNSSLAVTNTIALSDTVTDIMINKNTFSTLYSCGYNFVSSINIAGAPPAPAIITSQTNPTTCACNGIATASFVICGQLDTTGVNYQWSNGQTTQTITGLCPGTYVVGVTIGSNCSNSCSAFTNTVTITGGSVLSATVTTSPAVCGNNNGSANVTVTTGTAPYTYQWFPSGGNSSAASGLSAGNYTVIISDAAGCSNTQTISITSTGGITATVSSTQTNCTNPVGTATANPNTGTSPYTYLWNTTPLQSGQTATGLSAGNYTVTIADANGCTTTNTVTISSSGSITAAAGPNSTICAGQTISLSASGGTNYSWNTGASSSSILVSPAINTTYSVIVSTGTCIDTAFVTAIVNPLPIVNVPSTTVCTGDAATLTASGGINYSWSNGSTSNPIVVNPASTTSYTVTATDANGCSNLTSATVNVSAPPIASASSVTICAGASTTLSAQGGGNYLWSTGATTSSITVAATAAASYSVIVSFGSCADTANAFLTITPSPAVSLGNNLTICVGQISTLDAGNPGAGYLWSTGETTQVIFVSGAGTYWVIVGVNNCLAKDSVTAFIPPDIHLSDSSLCTASPIILDPGSGATSYYWSNGSTSQTISVDSSGIYWVTAMFGNCASTAVSSISGTEGMGSLYVPNAFTPNEDNLNEIFLAEGTGIKTFEMNIFDRWGNLIFNSDDINKGWNGKIEGGHYLLKGDGREVSQEDVYVWKINYTTQCFPKKINRKIGNVAIVK